MFGQNVNNDFYSTLNKTICKLTECEGHNSSRREARRVLRLFADRDKRYAHPVRINKAIIIITLHNELCFICFIPFHFHFVTIAESSLQVFLLFHAIYQGNWPINQKKKFDDLRSNFHTLSATAFMSLVFPIEIIIMHYYYNHYSSTSHTHDLFSAKKNLFELQLR